MSLSERIERTYTETLVKFTLVIEEGGRLLRIGDLAGAGVLFRTLRNYADCRYCSAFRMSLTVRHLPGACLGCPVHRYGETKAGRRLAYNGCYQVPEYEMMVRRAVDFERSPCQDSGAKVLAAVEAVKDIFTRDREEFLRC